VSRPVLKHREIQPQRAIYLSPALRWERFTKGTVSEVPEGRIKLAQRFSVCVRTHFRATKWNGLAGNPAPEGRPSLAQRFSAGKGGGMIQVPEGRLSSGATLKGWYPELTI